MAVLGLENLSKAVFNDFELPRSILHSTVINVLKKAFNSTTEFYGSMGLSCEYMGFF